MPASPSPTAGDGVGGFLGPGAARTAGSAGRGDSTPTATPPAAVPPAPLLPALAGFGFDLLLWIALLAGLSVLGTLVWGFAHGLSGAAAAQTEPPLSAVLAISLSATAIAALIVYYFRRNANAVERAASWRALRRPSSWGWIVTAVIVLITCSVGADQLTRALDLDATPTNQILGEPMRTRPLLWLAFAVLLAPAYEELMFRRVLFGRLWAAGRPWLGLALSSAAFALVHEPPGLGAGRGWGVLVLWAVYALMGAIFAWIYRRTGSLWTAYLAHAGNNLIACLALIGSA